MTNRWLLLNFDVLGAIAVLVTTLFSVATLTNGAGLAGLCITSAMAFTSSGKVSDFSPLPFVNPFFSLLGLPILDR